MDLTWNHRLLTILLSSNSGRTQMVPNVHDRNILVQDQTARPVVGDRAVNRYLRAGRRPLSKKKMLSQNTPPLSTQHCSVRVNTFGSLENTTSYYF